MVGLLAYIRHKSVCNLQAVRDNPPWDDLCNCGLRETWRDAVADPGAGLREALADAALWLEAEADHPRPDPRPAMRLQASLIRIALTYEPGGDPPPHPDDDRMRVEDGGPLPQTDAL